jgi:predicted Zn-dependent peptidase
LTGRTQGAILTVTPFHKNRARALNLNRRESSVRRSLRLVICVAAAVVVASPLWAQTLEEKVKEFELDNGMQFLVVERHEAPVVFCAVAFRVGGIYERPGITGISHLLEHMLFKGTETLGTKDFEAEVAFLEREDEFAEAARDIMLELEPWRLEYLDEYATDIVASFTEEERDVIGTDRGLELKFLVDRLAGDGPTEDMLAIDGLLEEGEDDYFARYVELKTLEMELYRTMEEHQELVISNELWETYMNNGSRMLNAGTGQDGTFYFAYLPSNRLELFMLMEADRLANAVFREYYTERDVVMEERRMSENEPQDVLYESFMATAYTAGAYGVPVLGWMSDVKMITRGDLQDYYDQYYVPNNAMGIFVGDVDVDQVKRFAKRYFGPIPRGEDLPALTTREPAQQGERRIVVKQDAKPTLMVGYHVPVVPHPDAYALDVLQSVLAGGRTSRFYRSIYEEQGLTRDAPGAWTGPGERLDPLFIIEADPKEPHTLDEVEDAIYAELERLKVEPVSDRELERIMNQQDAELVRALGSNIWLAFRVGMAASRSGDWRDLLRDIERRRAVTAEDIMRVANEYLTEENRTVGWLVETASEGDESDEETIDFAELMAWTRTLPEEEQHELMMKFQTLDEQGRQAFAEELWARMKAEQGSE